MNRIYKKTFRTQKKLNKREKQEVEYFLQVAEQKDGSMRILDAAKVPQGGSFKVKAGTTFVVHLHYVGLERMPSKGDHSPPHDAGLPNVTITPNRRDKCCNVFEVGRQSKRYQYRSIKDNKIGKWKERPEWN